MIQLLERPTTATYRYVSAYKPIVYKVWLTPLSSVYYPSSSITNLLEIEIREVGTDTMLAKFYAKPTYAEPNVIGGLYFYDSKFNVDVSEYVKAYINGNFEKPTLNKKQTKNSLYFYLVLKFIDFNGVLVTFKDIENPCHAVLGALEPSEYDNKYILFTPDKTGAIKSSFLSAFKEGNYYKGYHNYISFIYSEVLSGVELIADYAELNVNDVSVTTSEVQLTTTERNGLNVLKIKNVTNTLTKKINLKLKVGIAKVDGYVESGYVESGYRE